MLRVMSTLGVAFLFCGAAHVLPAPPAEDTYKYLHFRGSDDHVEIEKTRGCLDLNKPYTIEMWCRWSTDVFEKRTALAGDEVWPGMHPELPVAKEGGWVLRLSRLKEADKNSLEINLAINHRGKGDWFTVESPTLKILPKKWHHVAVCRGTSEVRLFWNGRLVGRRNCEGVSFLTSPSNIFLGVRKNAWVQDREFIGDIRAFRLSNQTRYWDNFTPKKELKKDKATLVLLDFNAADELKVPDLSDHERHGNITGAKIQETKEEDPPK